MVAGQALELGRPRTTTDGRRPRRPTDPASYGETTGPRPRRHDRDRAVGHVDKDVSGGRRRRRAATQPGDSYTYTITSSTPGRPGVRRPRHRSRPTTTHERRPRAAEVVTDGWTAADRDMAWRIPGPIQPGAANKVTLPHRSARRHGGLADGEAIAEHGRRADVLGDPSAQRDTDGFDYRNYTNVADDTVTLTADLPQLDIVKTTGLPSHPDTGDAEIGVAFPWRITVTNVATTAVAHDVARGDILPADWDYVAGSASPGPSIEAPAARSPGRMPVTWRRARSLTLTLSARPTEAAAAGADPQANTATATAVRRSSATGYTDSDTATATLVAPELEVTQDARRRERRARRARRAGRARGEHRRRARANVEVIRTRSPTGMAYTGGGAPPTRTAASAETVGERRHGGRGPSTRSAPAMPWTSRLPVLPAADLATGATRDRHRRRRGRRGDERRAGHRRVACRSSTEADVDSRRRPRRRRPSTRGQTLAYTLTAHERRALRRAGRRPSPTRCRPNVDARLGRGAVHRGRRARSSASSGRSAPAESRALQRQGPGAARRDRDGREHRDGDHDHHRRRARQRREDGRERHDRRALRPEPHQDGRGGRASCRVDRGVHVPRGERRALRRHGRGDHRHAAPGGELRRPRGSDDALCGRGRGV